MTAGKFGEFPNPNSESLQETAARIPGETDRGYPGASQVPNPAPPSPTPALKGTCGWSSLEDEPCGWPPHKTHNSILKHTHNDKPHTLPRPQPRRARNSSLFTNAARACGRPAPSRHPAPQPSAPPSSSRWPPQPEAFSAAPPQLLSPPAPAVGARQAHRLLTASSRSIAAPRKLPQPGPVTRVASAASGRGGRSPSAGNARSAPRIPCACAAGNRLARGQGSAKPAAPWRTIFVSYS